jgi:hypothetical protein
VLVSLIIAVNGVMSMVDPNTTDALSPVELSEAELNEVAGGLDVNISGVFFKDSLDVSAQETISEDGTGSSSLSYSAKKSVFAFQFVGSFQTAESFLGFLFGLSKMLRNRGFL